MLSRSSQRVHRAQAGIEVNSRGGKVCWVLTGRFQGCPQLFAASRTTPQDGVKRAKPSVNTLWHGIASVMPIATPTQIDQSFSMTTNRSCRIGAFQISNNLCPMTFFASCLRVLLFTTLVAAGAVNAQTLTAVPIQPPHLSNEDAGSLPGSLGVGKDGGATYSVTLDVPPGTAGMAPKLSLAYASQSPNGLMGVGWSLVGLSTIHRCVKTIAQDGQPGRINFDNADRLCLDGQRLVRVDGSNPGTNVSAVDTAYWAAGAQYRTEQESFARVTRTANGGFKVETKDGRIQFYGTETGTNGSYVVAQGRQDGQALVWALGRVEDRSGNYLTIEYSRDAGTGEYLPMQIRYGGNSTAAQVPDLAVRFVYEARGDAQVRFFGGSRNDLRSRLTHVQTYIDTATDGTAGTLIRDYTVHYTASVASARSLVDWIQACARNPQSALMDCLPKTTFDWGQAEVTYKESSALSWPIKQTGAGSLGDISYEADFDGDGIADYLFPTTGFVCPVDPTCVRIPTDDGRGNENAPYYYLTDEIRVVTLGGSDARKKLVFATGSFPTNISSMLIGDLDGNGLADVVLIKRARGPQAAGAVAGYCLNDGSPILVCKAATISSGTAPSGITTNQVVGGGLVDVFNDRKMHLFVGLQMECSLTSDGEFQCRYIDAVNVTPPATGYVNPLAMRSFSPSSIEFSKQGISDFYSVFQPVVGPGVAPREGVATCLNKASVVADTLRFECQTNFEWVNNTPTLRGAKSVGDLNGDGLTDFAFAVQGGGVYVCLSKESGVDCQPTGTTSWTSGSNDLGDAVVGDIAGDGSTGLMIHRVNSAGVTSAEWCRLDGQQKLVCHPLALPDLTGYVRSGIADVDGTGVPKVIYLLKDDLQLHPDVYSVRARTFTLAASAAQDRIIGVTNGLGYREEIDYARADDTAVFRRLAVIDGVERRHVYPKVSMAPGVMVKQLRRSNGQGGWLQTGYHYEGAATHALGRGSVGFALVQTTDIQTGIKTVNTFAQDYPYVGMVKTSRTYGPDGVLLSDVGNAFDKQVLTHASNAQTVFAFNTQSVVVKRDLDGSDLGTTTTTNQYGDGWGNLTQQDVSIAGGGKTFTSHTASTYSNDSTLWLLGLPTSLVVTKTDPVGGSLTRTTASSYDASNGLLKTETIEPGVAAYEVVTTHDRTGNQFGLVNRKTQAWFDPATQSAKTRTLSDTTYDTKGRFAIASKNALGHTETSVFDRGTGVATSLKNPNLLTTTWTLDGFGRAQKEVRADSNETRRYMKRCQGDCPEGAVTAAITDNFHGSDRNAVPTVVYADSAGHVLRTMNWGFDGRQIVGDQRFDALGRLHEVDQPRFAGDVAYLDRRLDYDVLSRQTTTLVRDESGIDRITTINYRGLVTTLTNANGQVRIDTNDVLGRDAEIKDAKGGLTTFAYDAFGNLTRTVDPNGNVITVSHDAWGHRTDMRDPNLGWIHYDVDPLGQTWRQISPKQRAASQSTRTEFDALGRMTARYETDLESHWIYDTAANGVGQLAEAYTGTPTLKDYRRQNAFDSLGRLGQVTLTLDTTYVSKTDYDEWGRQSKQTYQRASDAAKVYDSRYNGYGFLNRFERSGLALWQASAQDAAHRVTQTALGNGLSDFRSYNAHTGRLVGASLQTGSQQARLQEGYQYDALGNVTQRIQYWDASGFQEYFGYDELNRLTSSQVAGAQQQAFAYDAVGNITSKTGMGRFGYGGATASIMMIDLDDILIPIPVFKPATPGSSAPVSALTTIVGMGNFAYDANGNLISGGGRTLNWTSFDMPVQITKGSMSSTFVYGPDHQRAKHVRSDGATVYYAGNQEVETKGGQVTVKTYWPGGIGVEIDRPGRSTELDWIHRDRLGSPIALTDQIGGWKERLSYDAWGKRRTTDGAATPDSLDGQVDNKGFTGHEMLDQLDLVHMNGRVYDPLLGRFVSGDPLVTDLANGQSYNRYAYVLNNPTNLTDPTGFAEAKHDTKPNIDCSKSDVCKKVEEAAKSGISIVVREKDGSVSETVSFAGSADGDKRRGGAAKGAAQKQSAMDLLFPKGDFFRTAGEAFGALGAFAVGLATGDPALKNAAIDGMRENVSSADGVNAAIMLAGSTRSSSPAAKGVGKLLGPATDKAGNEIGRIIVDSRGNAMIEPVGGRTVAAGRGSVDTHTLYPNGSNYQRLNPQGHANNATPHGHGHAPGTAPGMRGQGSSLDVNGNVVPWNSPAAHWPIN
jgi:RHS repeat-associated protein